MSPDLLTPEALLFTIWSWAPGHPHTPGSIYFPAPIDPHPPHPPQGPTASLPLDTSLIRSRDPSPRDHLTTSAQDAAHLVALLSHPSPDLCSGATDPLSTGDPSASEAHGTACTAGAAQRKLRAAVPPLLACATVWSVDARWRVAACGQPLALACRAQVHVADNRTAGLWALGAAAVPVTSTLAEHSGSAPSFLSVAELLQPVWARVSVFARSLLPPALRGSAQGAAKAAPHWQSVSLAGDGEDSVVATANVASNAQAGAAGSLGAAAAVPACPAGFEHSFPRNGKENLQLQALMHAQSVDVALLGGLSGPDFTPHL